MYPGPNCIVGPLEPTPAGSPVREILGSSPPGPTAAGAPWSALICISLSIEGPEGWARWGELGCSLKGGGQDRDETISLTFVPCEGCATGRIGLARTGRGQSGGHLRVVGVATDGVVPVAGKWTPSTSGSTVSTVPTQGMARGPGTSTQPHSRRAAQGLPRGPWAGGPVVNESPA